MVAAILLGFERACAGPGRQSLQRRARGKLGIWRPRKVWEPAELEIHRVAVLGGILCASSLFASGM